MQTDPIFKGEFPPEYISWYPIPGYSSNYEASDIGQIRSVKNKRPLIPWIDSKGRCFVKLYHSNTRTSVAVHSLVLLAFRGPLPPGLERCHNDGNASNNCLSNLRYDTPESNINDRRKHGYFKNFGAPRRGRKDKTVEPTFKIRRR